MAKKQYEKEPKEPSVRETEEKVRAEQQLKYQHPVPDLTQKQAMAILSIDLESGSDIRDQNVAIEFRRMQMTIPYYERYFQIVPSTTRKNDLLTNPYFRITVTKEAVELASKYKSTKNQMSGITP